MTPQEIHEIATIEVGFRPEVRVHGYSYWTHEQGDRKSVRIFRISKNSAVGVGVTQIKLAVSSF